MATCFPGVAHPADARTAEPDGNGRRIFAEYQFGDVRFVSGGGETTRWLEVYSRGNLVDSFRDFIVDDVIASSDQQHFVALSNSLKSSYAFLVLDRNGKVESSGTHGGDLHYCRSTAWGIGEWYDAKRPGATFSIEKNHLTSPATPFLYATVRGCDGRTVIVARPHSTPPNPGATAAEDGHALDRGSFFIGAAIANLRGLDPTFGGRTLTLFDGRRQARPAQSYKYTALSLPGSWSGAPLSIRQSCTETRTGQLCGESTDLVAHLADGSKRVLASELTGDFIALPRSQQILACMSTPSGSEPTRPVLVDLNTTRYWLPAHPGPLRICARTGTGSEVLLVYTMAEPGKAYALARVFDASGALLAEGRFEKPGKLEYTVAGKAFSEEVPGP